MNPSMIRWKISPSYRCLPFTTVFVLGSVHSLVPSASPVKLATVFGASFSKSSAVNFPIDVSKCAYTPGFNFGFSCAKAAGTTRSNANISNFFMKPLLEQSVLLRGRYQQSSEFRNRCAIIFGSVMYQQILFSTADSIATIVINRPAVRNALNAATLTEIRDAIESARNDANVRVVIITGSGDRAFVAG